MANPLSRLTSSAVNYWCGRLLRRHAVHLRQATSGDISPLPVVNRALTSWMWFTARRVSMCIKKRCLFKCLLTDPKIPRCCSPPARGSGAWTLQRQRSSGPKKRTTVCAQRRRKKRKERNPPFGGAIKSLVSTSMSILFTFQRPKAMPGLSSLNSTSLSSPIVSALCTSVSTSNLAMRDLQPGLEEAGKEKRVGFSVRGLRRLIHSPVCRAVSLLQARAVEGYSPDTVELKGGNVPLVGQTASPAPAQGRRSLREARPAQLMSGLQPRLIRDRQLPGDVQVPAIRRRDEGLQWHKAFRASKHVDVH